MLKDARQAIKKVLRTEGLRFSGGLDVYKIAELTGYSVSTVFHTLPLMELYGEAYSLKVKRARSEGWKPTTARMWYSQLPSVKTDGLRKGHRNVRVD